MPEWEGEAISYQLSAIGCQYLMRGAEAPRNGIMGGMYPSDELWKGFAFCGSVQMLCIFGVGGLKPTNMTADR
ncbi:MAG: hypothetical protein H6581_29620 [Bacteroidia bacterium]|nr:hypothetical protein [Bacteroidia bacterium]